MRRIFWDTNLFVYLLEGRGKHAEQVVALRQRMAAADQLYTSTLTLGELLVKPAENAQPKLVADYEDLLAQAATILPFDCAAARAFAAIRSDRSIKPPDAIQLACAAAAGISLFVTNDSRLSRKNVPGIQFITSIEVALQLT